MKHVILASASPRRKELLQQAGISFQAEASRAEEVVTSNSPIKVVEELSCLKAMEVAKRQERREGDIVLGADTIVVMGQEILGKPADEEQAFTMLAKLQGQTHQVYTGVTVLTKVSDTWQKNTFSEMTEVTFYPMSEAEIREYIQTGEPMDKAGAYGIQGRFAVFIKKIDGDYYNVVGLPIARVYQVLKTKEPG